MECTKIYQFPKQEEVGSNEIVQVLIARTGEMKIIAELSSNGLESIKRVARATGVHYIDFLLDISRSSQSVKSAMSIKSRKRSLT